MAKEKTKAYVVTQTGMQNRKDGGEHEVGDVVNLTEAQAAARVGKVVLKSEAGSPAPEANNKLVETVTEQAGQIAELTTANTEGKAQAEELTKTNAELVEANTALTTQVETLTKTNGELTAANVKLTEAAKVKTT